MNILLLGSGGREHALAWKIAGSPLLTRLWCAPGNAGMAQEAECVALDIANHQAVIDFCKANRVDFVMVGPEAPLAAGIVDDLAAAGFKAFGPSKAASQLESSKGFTKDLCQANNIPTAAYQRFSDAAKAKAYIRQMGAPIVVKADGLAAGKGVLVTKDRDAALSHAEHYLQMGPVLIEEFLDGQEISLFFLSDGHDVVPLSPAQDYKRVGDGDTGPNTGGMGAYSPAPVVTADVHQRVMDLVIWPTVRGMADEGNVYTGFLYAGLMIDKAGNPKVIEFNCRFGDPETQPVMLRLQSSRRRNGSPRWKPPKRRSRNDVRRDGEDSQIHPVLVC